MDKYVVSFVVDDYAFNDRCLATSPGELRPIYKITANSPEEAYLKAVQEVRKITKNTFRLNFCKRTDCIGREDCRVPNREGNTT